MSLAGLMNRPCSIVNVDTSGTEDVFGDVVYDETATVATVCYVEQRQAREQTAGANTQIEEWLVVLPAGTVIDGAARVVVADLTLEVQGPPWPVWNPRTQAVSHIECTAKQVV
jgi:hypothetical protein